MRSKFSYFVEDPKTDRETNKTWPVLKITIEELSKPMVTKTGKIGKCIVATISTAKSVVCEEYALCIPEDDYSFEFGAKLALKRLLYKSFPLNKDRDMRRNIWNGFNHFVPLEH